MVRFELMFLIFAGMLFSMLILTENAGNMSTEDTILTSKIGLNAVSVANSFIEKVTGNSLYFDEYTRDHAIQPRPVSPSDSAALLGNLSSVLGRDPGEASLGTFDDVDDFNNYDDTASVAGVGLFHILCRVQYYDPSTNTSTSSKTWYKIFTVSVTDTVPGSDIHYLQIQGQQIAIRRSVILSYYNFL